MAYHLPLHQCGKTWIGKIEVIETVRLLRAVMDAGRELWRYYHQQENANPNALFYDIRLHFQGTKQTKSGKEQMNSDSADAKYTELIAELRRRLKALAKKIEPKVYDYGFMKR